MSGSHYLFLLLAGASGAAMAAQGSLNAVLRRFVGSWEATFVVHAVGLVAALAAVFTVRRGSLGSLSSPGTLGSAPWFTYMGGILGVLLIFGVLVSISKVGVASATTAIIVGQVLAAVLIDHFGAFGVRRIPFHWLQFVGLALLAVGARLMLK